MATVTVAHNFKNWNTPWVLVKHFSGSDKILYAEFPSLPFFDANSVPFDSVSLVNTHCIDEMTDITMGQVVARLKIKDFAFYESREIGVKSAELNLAFNDRFDVYPCFGAPEIQSCSFDTSVFSRLQMTSGDKCTLLFSHAGIGKKLIHISVNPEWDQIYSNK